MCREDKTLDALSHDEIVTYYNLYRAQEEHENELIHQRTLLFITLQSVVLATFGFSFQKILEVSPKLFSSETSESPELIFHCEIFFFTLFLIILCFVGIQSSLTAKAGITAAYNSQKSIREKWLKVKKRYTDKYPFRYQLPPFSGGREEDFDPDTGSSFHASLPISLLRLWWVLIFVSSLLAAVIMCLIFVKGNFSFDPILRIFFPYKSSNYLGYRI